MNGTYIGNRGGIVYTNAVQTVAGSTTANAVYTLPNHIFRLLGPVGLMVVTFPTPGEGGTILGITVLVNGQSLTLTDAQNAPLTAAPTAGDYILSFNKVMNTLKIMD